MARILIADDEEGLRDFIATALARDGHATTTAADGDEAARLLERQAFDVLITDLRMPGQDGMQLLRRVRAEQPEVEVIVLTAHGTIDTAVEAIKAGAFDYLQKPVQGPAELRLLVARAAERRALRDLEARLRRDDDDEPVLTWGAPSMAPVVAALRKVAVTGATVLLLGESGTGKEVVARAIHRWSERRAGPFVAVNCAALTETLLESELFGHEKGAFTGAVAQRRGRIELAQGGTFFLDEIGELRPELQAKLLRVLQERRFERLGGQRTIETDARWIAATNRDLGAMIAAGKFREDLYHRLAVFPIKLPPLRERRADVVALATRLLHAIGAELGRPGLRLSPAAAARLEQASWPGNVRELRNVLERGAILADGVELEVAHLWMDPAGGEAARPAAPALTLDELERHAIEQALADVGGNRKEAAARLGIGLRTLYEKLKRYGISEPR